MTSLSAPVVLSGPDGANLYTERRRKLEAQRSRLGRRLLDRKELAAYIQGHPDQPLTEVLTHIGWTRARSLAALSALVELGIVEITSEGRLRRATVPS